MDTQCNLKIQIQKEMCKERVETILANLCNLNENDEVAVGELLYAIRFRKGMNQSEIAKLENVSRQAVSQRIKRSMFLSNIQKIQKRQKLEDRWRIAYNLYEKGLPLSEIAKQLNTNKANVTARVRKYAKSHNLPFKLRMERKKK